jgi:hypothetical protein
MTSASRASAVGQMSGQLEAAAEGGPGQVGVAKGDRRTAARRQQGARKGKEKTASHSKKIS